MIVGIVILVMLVAFLAYTMFFSVKATSSWSAVFLNNGRTYFGHIIKQDVRFLTLTNVYYIQVQQLAPDQEGAQPQQQLSLVNIADELHQPEDVMKINLDNVLFVQELKEDSQIVTTIGQLSK